MVEEVDPAVRHQQPRPQAGHHGQALPGERVGEPEQGEEDGVGAAEPHELAVTAGHPELLELDGPGEESVPGRDERMIT